VLPPERSGAAEHDARGVRRFLAGVAAARDVVSVAAAHVPMRWWRRPPFLPLPDRAWMRFRRETAFGSSRLRPSRADLTQYITWCGEMRRMRRRPGRSDRAR